MPRRTKPPKLLSPQQQAKFLRKQERRAKTDAWLKAHPKTRIALYTGVIVFALLLCSLCACGTLAAFHSTEATASAIVSNKSGSQQKRADRNLGNGR